MKKILITGAGGLVGTRLTTLLLERGYEVVHLSRTPLESSKIKTFRWDINTSYIDLEAIQNVDAIIHLAGENIGAKTWTDKRKKEIRDSRVKSSNLLIQTLQNNTHCVKTIVSASAIGYYKDMGNEWLYENDDFAKNFLGITCVAWENEIKQSQNLYIRFCILRTGIVLSKDGGALPRIIKPIRYGMAAALGSGLQWMSWIHLDDLCAIYLYAIENEKMSGVYNAVAPNPVNNKTFTQIAAKIFKRPYFFPPIPAFVLKLILGEFSTLILNGARVSAQKLIDTKFGFTYPDLESSLKTIYKINN